MVIDDGTLSTLVLAVRIWQAVFMFPAIQVVRQGYVSFSYIVLSVHDLVPVIMGMDRFVVIQE